MRSMMARPVLQSQVIVMLLSLGAAAGPAAKAFPDVAAGISRAANRDPLFSDQVIGAEMTACILTAYAYVRSRFNPYSGNRDSVGLYRLRAPYYPRVRAESLMHPESASLILTDLIRSSIKACKDRPAAERLGWVLALQYQRGDVDMSCRHVPPDAFEESRGILVLAKKLHESHFGGPTDPTDRRLALPEKTGPLVRHKRKALRESEKRT